MARVITTTEKARRLAICAECPHVIMTVRGACEDCGKVQTVTGKDGWPCKACGGEIHPREGKKLDFELPRCGDCGCPLATRVYAWCPLPGDQRKW